MNGTVDIPWGLRRLRQRLIVLAFVTGALTLLVLIVSSVCDHGTCSQAEGVWINAVAQTILILACFRAIFLMVRLDSSSLWTPAVLFPAGIALFFGFGSMSTFFSSTATLSHMMAGSYGITPLEQLRTNALTFSGVTTALLTMVFMMRVRLGKWQALGQSRRVSLQVTASLFLVGGGFLKYGLILPNSFGVIDITLPGTLKSMGALVDLGFAVTAFLVLRGSRGWAFVFWLFWPPHLAFSVLEFSKVSVIFAIMLPAAGAYLAHHRLKRLVPWVVLAAFAFVVLQDVNTAGRLTIKERTGSISEANFGERIDIVSRVLASEITVADTATEAVAAAQIWWLRLNIAGAQLRAMELYDAGVKGEWTLSIAAVFVPRFMWPEKPVQVAQGRVFNRIVTGNHYANTHVGASVFADGYWQMGWGGAILFSGIMGAILGFVTVITYRAVAERQLIYLPVVFLGMSMALVGPTNVLQRAFVGALPILLGYLLLIFVLQMILRSSHHKRVQRKKQFPTRHGWKHRKGGLVSVTSAQQMGRE